MIPEITTIEGKVYNYLTPDPDSITIPAIAAALSKQCRFAGHVIRFYSVAEHCVRGSYACDDPLDFLLHDASEFAVVDVPTPMKMLIRDVYQPIEDRAHAAIALKFGTHWPHTDAVRHTDLVMLATERRDLKLEGAAWPILEGIVPLDLPYSLAARSGRPETWERRYIERFAELTQ